MLSVYRETVKPGKNAAHDLNEEAWARALFNARAPSGYLANWAALEAANRATEASPALMAIGKRYSAMEADLLSDGRAMILTVREDLSYRSRSTTPSCGEGSPSRRTRAH